MTYAGFFYIGREDVCVCFACGLALHRWTNALEIRRNIDPIAEHYAHNNDCAYVQTLFFYPNDSYFPVTERKVARHGDLVDRLLERYNTVRAGVEREHSRVTEWIGRSHAHLTRIRSQLDKATTWLQRTVAEIPTIEFIDDDPSGAYATLLSSFEDVDANLIEHRSPLTCPTRDFESTVVTLDPVVSDSASMKTTGSRPCCVCMSNESNVLFLPCRHTVCCPLCSKDLKMCPVCRESVWFRVTCMY
ncbi:putative inhibitor of apoptosis [Pseudomyrmex gracilis]|uniref:putative inhibitor of apoptosis n=1 Tax=Pseudomyrmex gracilis TaxID=219809 RepID=UPI000995CE51|nr:putative inhibitor of apoptosis [Pseudomyrmex gracilis]